MTFSLAVISLVDNINNKIMMETWHNGFWFQEIQQFCFGYEPFLFPRYHFNFMKVIFSAVWNTALTSGVVTILSAFWIGLGLQSKAERLIVSSFLFYSVNCLHNKIGIGSYFL